MENILLSLRCRTVPLLGAKAGQLIFSMDGNLALTVMWEGSELDPNHGAYVPLMGDDAFRVQWIERKYNRTPEVLLVADCEMLVQPSSLATVPVGFDTREETSLPIGGLFFGPDGARVLAVHDDEKISVSLADGRFVPLNGQVRYPGAGEWALTLMRGEMRCFTAHFKRVTAPTTGVDNR